MRLDVCLYLCSMSKYCILHSSKCDSVFCSPEIQLLPLFHALLTFYPPSSLLHIVLLLPAFIQPHAPSASPPLLEMTTPTPNNAIILDRRLARSKDLIWDSFLESITGVNIDRLAGRLATN